MVRMVILRFAQEQGHTVITSALVEQATARFCPGHGKANDAGKDLPWTDEAKTLIDSHRETSAIADIRLRAEKRARREGAEKVTSDHVQPFLEMPAASRPTWDAAALARLNRLPDMAREAVRRRADAHTCDAGQAQVTVDIVEAAIAESRRTMEQAMLAGGHRPSSGT